MKVLSVIFSFPDNYILVARFRKLIEEPTLTYKLFCWKSKVDSWHFWGDQLPNKSQKFVIVSGLIRLLSFRTAPVEILSLLWFTIFRFSKVNRYFQKHPNRNWKKKIIDYINDYKILKNDPDILHFEFGTLGISKIFIKDVLNCKAVVSFRGFDINYYKIDHNVVFNEVWKKTDGFHFLGRDLYNRAVKRGFTQQQDQTVSFISPAIDTEQYNRKSDLSSSTQFLRFISMGRLVWKKGIAYGLLAFQNYLDKGGDGEYLIIGDGSSLEECLFVAHELGIRDKVHFQGKVPPHKTIELLDNSDVFIHPAISEGFCNAVIEAQSMKLPVICTDADGLAENIQHGITGYVVPKWNYKQMTDRMYELLKNPQLRMEMGENGRKRVLKKFTLDQHGEAFLAFYNQVYQK